MGGVFLDRMVSEELTVKQKPKICEGENPAKIYSVSIPGKTMRYWGRDQLQELIQQ